MTLGERGREGGREGDKDNLNINNALIGTHYGTIGRYVAPYKYHCFSTETYTK